MSRQLDQTGENKNARLVRDAGKAVNGGLESALKRGGRDFRGLTIKWNGLEALCVVKARWEGQDVISFVGSSGVAECLAKAHRDAASGKLRWRADKYSGKQV